MDIAKISKNPAVISLISLILLLSAAIIEWADNTFISQPESWLYAAAFTAFVIICSLTIYAVLNRQTTQELFDEKIADLKNIIVSSNMSWLVNEKYVRALEDNSSDIWVFTPDLCNDINADGEIFHAVRNNLLQGKRYTYFVPSVTNIHGAISKYHRCHQFSDDQVTFCLIPEESYLFYTEAVVYNVHDDAKKTVGIEWLPVDKLNYYVELDEQHTDKLVAIGETLLRFYGEQANADVRA